MKDLIMFDFAIVDWIDHETTSLIESSARLVARKSILVHFLRNFLTKNELSEFDQFFFRLFFFDILETHECSASR